MNLSLTSIGKNLAHASLSLSICRVLMLHSAWSITSHRPYRAFQWSSWDHFLFLSVKVEDALKPQKKYNNKTHQHIQPILYINKTYSLQTFST